MIEKLRRWQEILENEWWGGCAVYVAALASSYLTIWSIIEPLSIPNKIMIFDSSIDRRLVHLLLSVFIAAHIPLLLDLIHRLKRSLYPLSDTSQLPPDTRLPEVTKESLMYYRILVKDESMSYKTFISLVLLAVNQGCIDSKFATELLRGTGVSIRKINNGDLYTIALEEDTR
ncbi:MAG: hypothetical protein GXP39_01100 [Chloroflexi bacterium]|nr:hypothetical protein [Chloroflexota bacterium]